MTPNRRLETIIAALRVLERKCFRSRDRFAFYNYLEAVYGLYSELRRNNEAKEAAWRIAKLFDIRVQKDTHPARVILDATSNADIKSKSRWMRALRLAWRERRGWTDINAFFRANGGPAGCADRLAAVKPIRPRRYVGFDRGRGRPRVPLIISKELL